MFGSFHVGYYEVPIGEQRSLFMRNSFLAAVCFLVDSAEGRNGAQHENLNPRPKNVGLRVES